MSSSQFIIEEWRDVWSFKADCAFVLLAYLFSNEDVEFVDTIVKYSGASFAIAYVATLLLCTLPLLIMELGVGQLAGKSPVEAMANICPLFKGVGVGLIVISLAVISWNAVLIGHVGYYLVQVFLNSEQNLPWTSCTDDIWKPEGCSGLIDETSENKSMLQTAEDYYKNVLLEQSSGLADTGELVWQNVAATGAVWLLTFFTIFLGIRWFSKVCYLTVSIPAVILFVLVVRTTTLPGAASFINDLFTVDWDTLLSLQLWKDVFASNLISVGLCYGAYITIGSYNKRSNNLVGDALILILSHIVITASRIFVDAGIRGHLKLNGITEKHFNPVFDNARTLGAPLTVVSHLQLPHIWASLLLFKTLFFSLNRVFVLAWNCVTAFEDATLSHKASRCLPRAMLAIVVCIIGFGASLGYTLQVGIHAVRLMTYFYDLLPLWILLAFQIIAVAYFYCAHLLGIDVRNMTENRCLAAVGLVFCELLYLLPAVPIYILFVKLYDLTEHGRLPEHIESVEWAGPVGWVLACVPLIPIPVFMVIVATTSCVKGPGFTYWQKFRYTLTSPLRYEVAKPSTPPRYNSTAPGYVLLPAAPLAEPEHYGENHERVIRVSNI